MRSFWFSYNREKGKENTWQSEQITYFVRNSISLYLSCLPDLDAMYLSNKYMLFTGHSKDFFQLNKYFLPNVNISKS